MLWTFFVRKINKYKMYIIYIFNGSSTKVLQNKK
jgi:hypothetical protein